MFLVSEIIQIISDLREVQRESDFSGCGIVVYRGRIEAFPVSALVEDSKLRPPIATNQEIARFIFSISRYEDVRHDGFHFVHEQLGLTDIAQYFSPQIPKGFQPGRFAIGARYRSAELGSHIENVESVAIVGREGGIVRFKDGIEVMS